jgi:RNA polymerase primary sigma factor
MKRAGDQSLASITEEESAFYACRDESFLVKTDETGKTELHHAAKKGKSAICRIYLNAGIDPSKTDNFGQTAADVAKIAGYLSLARSLQNAIIDQLPGNKINVDIDRDRLLDPREQQGLISGKPEVVHKLIATLRINARNAKGDTPLHLAASGGHLHLCSQLFEAGANVAIKNDSGQTSSEMAAEAGQWQLAELLRGLVLAKLEKETQSGSISATADDLLRKLPVSEVSVSLDRLEFDVFEEPAAFHIRRGVAAVSGTFVAIRSNSGIETGEGGKDGDWDLPGSLLKVRVTDHAIVPLKAGQAISHKHTHDFSYTISRKSRPARRLRGTSFNIAEQVSREWVRDVLTAGKADEQTIHDLINQCEGNHLPAELADNLRKLMGEAGILTDNSFEPFLQFEQYPTIMVEADDLHDAVSALCCRNTVVPGRHVFSVSRATEERLAREVSNARNELLNFILDQQALLSVIIQQSKSVFNSEMAVDEFTDLDVDGFEAIDRFGFEAAVETLDTSLKMGIEIGGRARRAAMEALDSLEITRSCLDKLATESGQEIGSALVYLLSSCDRSTEHFIEAHLPFARRETAKMALSDEDPEELFQEAYFAIRRAAEKYESSRGVRFYIYALYWIRQQINRYRLNNKSIIRVPIHRHELHAKITAYRERFEQNYLRGPTDAEIADYVECDVKAVKSLELAFSEPLNFLDEMAETTGSSESSEDVVHQQQSSLLINEALEHLDPRERDVILRRFGIGLESDMTLEEIGQIYGVTRERIRQIEAKSIKKLIHPNRARNLRGLL